MFKAIKKFFSGNPPEVSYPTSLFIRRDEGSIEDAAQQICNTQKFKKWLNCFPILWTTFDREYIEEGCKGRFFFVFGLFSYRVEFVEVIPNKLYRAKVSGPINGEIAATFIQKEDGVLFDHPFSFTAANMLIYRYYNILLRPRHIPYMESRYEIFKKNVIKDALERKQGRN